MDRISDICEIIPVWGLNEEEWRTLRQPTLGGSDIAAAAGIDRYRSPLQLWAEKLGRIESFAGNSATRLGNLLERPVAEAFAQETGKAIVEWPVLLRSRKYEYAAANLDFLIVEPTENWYCPDGGDIITFKEGEVTFFPYECEPPGIEAILECKTGAIASPGSPHLWFQGPTGESVPENYQCQGYWYMAVTGLDRVEFAALIGGHGLLTRPLDRDEEVIEDLLSLGADFYQHLITETAPDPDGSQSTDETLKALYPVSTPDKLVEGGEALRLAWEAHQEAKVKVEAAKSEAVEARARVITILGDAERGLVDGVEWMSYKNNRPSEKFDDKKFKQEHPDIWKQYVHQAPGARVLRETRS